MVVEDNIFAGKEDVSKNKVVRDYIRQHIGEVKTISSDGRAVYIGKELPGEYTLSQYSKNLRSNRTLSNAKNQAAQNLGELIEIAENPSWQENRKAKHAMDAKYGWWRYNTRFAIPGKSKYHIFDANLLIRHAADGKYYLYDVLGIKENRTSAEGYQVAIASQKGGSQGSASDNTIAQRATGVNNQSMQNQAEHAQPRRKFSVAEDAEGRQIVVVEDNIFAGKRDKPRYKVVRDYLREHIGEIHTIASDGRAVYLGKDLPGEYTLSEYSKRLLRKDKSKAYAKNQAAQYLGELIEIAENPSWQENRKAKHTMDAKYGWWKYDTRFAVPVRDNSGKITNYRTYDASLLIRHDADGKYYLYDILGINENRTSARGSQGAIASLKGGSQDSASDNTIAQRATGVNHQSMQNQAEHARLHRRILKISGTAGILRIEVKKMEDNRRKTQPAPIEEFDMEIMPPMDIEEFKKLPPLTQEARQRALKFVEEMERRRIEELKNTEK